MLRSWKIGSAFGIPIYIHPTFLLVFLMILLRPGPIGGIAGGIFLTAWILTVFLCVILHEFGHALTARYFGIKTRSVTIYPIGGVARLEGMTEKPHEEILIAIAGPAVNVLIVALLLPIVVLAGLTGAMPESLGQITLGGGIWPVLAHFAILVFGSNMALVIFNLIPAFPMDGGRVLRALLTMGLGFPRATEIAVRIGTVLAIVMGVVGFMFLNNYFMPFLVLFVILAGQQELMMVRYRERIRQAQRELAELRPERMVTFPVHSAPPVGRALEVLPPGSQPASSAAEPKLIFSFRVIEIPEPPR